MPTSKGTPFERLVTAEKLVHEPARLASLTALSACESADFVFLQRLTGLQPGNLSQHLAKLEEAGLVTLTKAFAGNYRQTTVRITEAGRKAVTANCRSLVNVAIPQRRGSEFPMNAILRGGDILQTSLFR